jgi:hypothetical protein
MGGGIAVEVVEGGEGVSVGEMKTDYQMGETIRVVTVYRWM